MTKLSIKRDIRKYQLLSIGLYLFVQLLSLIAPLLMGLVIDEYIPNNDTNKIIFGVVLFVTVPLISVLLQSLYNYLIIKFGRKEICVKLNIKAITRIDFFDIYFKRVR